MKLLKNTLLSLVVVASIMSTATAQSPWTNNTQGNFVSFEFSKPSTSILSDEESFFSACYDLSAGFEISEKSELIIDVPIAHFNLKNSDFDIDPETTFGNIYLALRTGDRSEAVRGEFGVFLPTASSNKDFAPIIGALALPNREEKFDADIWGIMAKVRAEEQLNDKGLFYRLNGGLTYGNMSSGDLELTLLYLDYVGQIGIRKDTGFTGVFGISGRSGLNNDSKYTEDDASSFIAGLGVSYRNNNFEPGFTLNLPLDDPFKEVLDNVINISFLYHFD